MENSLPGRTAWTDMIDVRGGGVAGKRVLDVGCGPEGSVVQQLFNNYSPAEVVGVDLAIAPQVFAPDCRIERGDVCDTAYPDGYFDLIVSSGAFEHIKEFDRALAEMYRILKPGGLLYTQFGPIWSCTFGHHLWANHQGVTYNYNTVTLPPWCHLLMEPAEVYQALKAQNKYEDEAILAITAYVFFSDQQNHMLFEDYEASFAKSGFDSLFLKGYGEGTVDAQYFLATGPEIFDALRQKFPGKRNFLYQGIECLLRKPAV